MAFKKMKAGKYKGYYRWIAKDGTIYYALEKAPLRRRRARE